MGGHRFVFVVFLLLAFLIISMPAFSQTVGPWKSNLTHRPRLLWEAGEWQGILDRLDREPYASLYLRAKTAAGATPQSRPAFYSPIREYPNANIAKNAAFVWAVEGNSTYAEKAALILEDLETDFNFPDLAGLVEILTNDVHTAEAMQGYCAAYDILAGTGYLSPTRNQAIHDRLELMFINAWELYFGTWYWHRFKCSPNNHFTKVASAFGTAAITLNDSDYALPWINHAMVWGTQRLFEIIITDEGTFVEGPSYGLYSEINHIPFFMQYDKFTDGESANFERKTCNFFGTRCTYDQVWVDNPIEDPRLLESVRWSVSVRLPDGTTPPFDDSYKRGRINGLLGSRLGDGELIWDWLNMPGEQLVTKYCADLTVDFICSYDDTITPTVPQRPADIAFPNDGLAVMRDAWAGDEYVLFLAEGGQARVMGSGHDHADNLSFMYWTQGRLMALDSGYYGWSDNGNVRLGRNHNVVAVDGQGPPATLGWGLGGVDAFLTAYDFDLYPKYVVGKTAYDNAKWSRALFYYGRYLVVADFMRSETVRYYEWLLHGNGGGSTGGPFQMLTNGATWQNENSIMELNLTGTGQITDSHNEAIHGFSYGQEETHEVYSGQMSGDDAGYIGALNHYYDVGDSKAITVNVLNLGADNAGVQISYDLVDDYIISSKNYEPGLLDLSIPIGVGSGFAWVRPSENTAVLVGKALYVGGRRIAHQKSETSMRVDWGDDWVEMTADTYDGNLLSVQTVTAPLSVTGSCVTQSEFRGGYTRIKINDSCTVHVEWAESSRLEALPPGLQSRVTNP